MHVLLDNITLLHNVFNFRFLPDGAYLNAKKFTPQNMAIKMDEIIRNKSVYYDFFRFHRYYSYHTISESEDTDPLCSFCHFVNNDTIRNARSTYSEFSEWWTKKNI